MKIKVSQQEQPIENIIFADVKLQQWFIYDGRLCIKIDDSGEDNNAVCLDEYNGAGLADFDYDDVIDQILQVEDIEFKVKNLTADISDGLK